MELKLEYSANKDQMAEYLTNFFQKHAMSQSQKAINFAMVKHAGQSRREGTPFICHPLTMACHGVAAGITEDSLIAAMLLHDVCEDCGVPYTDLPVGPVAQEAVKVLTRTQLEGESKTDALKRYYLTILQNREACIIKLFDRCHNVSTMAKGFSYPKMVDYIDETKNYVYPILNYVKEAFPEFQNMIYLLEYQMRSMMEAMETMLQLKL